MILIDADKITVKYSSYILPGLTSTYMPILLVLCNHKRFAGQKTETCVWAGQRKVTYMGERRTGGLCRVNVVGYHTKIKEG